jgi:hypothetical protein
MQTFYNLDFFLGNATSIIKRRLFGKKSKSFEISRSGQWGGQLFQGIQFEYSFAETATTL